jgi:hypothetical protein
MWDQIRLKLNNQIVAVIGLFGVGLLPCPDCGLPLAVKVWPAAGLVWLYRRFRRRSLRRLDLLLISQDPGGAHGPVPQAAHGDLAGQ